MKSPRSIRRLLRLVPLLVGTNVVLLAVLCIAATPAVRPLLLDTSNHPTENVDFASSHWTGDPTSGKAINPASTGATTPGTGAFTTVRGTYTSDSAPVYTFSNNLNSGFGILGGSNPMTVQNGVEIAEWFGYGTYYRNSAMQTGYVDAGLGYGGTGMLNITGGYSNPNGLCSLNLDNLTALGTISFDQNNAFSDGSGDLTTQNVVSGSFSTPTSQTYLYDGGLGVGGYTIVDDQGALYYNNGSRLTDNNDFLYSSTGDNLSDPQGYLYTGSQAYQAGVVAPTGYIVIKDANGTAYKIPAVAQ